MGSTAQEHQFSIGRAPANCAANQHTVTLFQGFSRTLRSEAARHVEAFSRFPQEKIDLVYPINKHLTSLLEDTLRVKCSSRNGCHHPA